MIKFGLALLLVAVAVAQTAGVAAATLVSLSASADATLFEESGDLASGADDGVFIGRNGSVGGFNERRALFNFDLSGVPRNARIQIATLALTLTRSQATGAEASLHRVNVAWREGQSTAVRGGGRGGIATPGSATWSFAAWDQVAWPAGGDYVDVASSRLTVAPLPGSRVRWSGVGLVSDVQFWLYDSAGQFGWLLLADTTPGVGNAMRFASREFAVAADRPVLELAYEIVPVPVPPLASTMALVLVGLYCGRRRVERKITLE